MSSEKVARLLTDFDLPDQQKGRSRVVPFDHTQHSSAKPQPKPPVPPAQREDDAYQRGRTEGYAAAAAEYEQKLNGESQKLRAVLTEERDKLLNDTAAKIARDIAEIGNQLETKIAAVTARVLEPFISSAVQKKAVASFCRAVVVTYVGYSPSNSTDIRTIRSAGAGAEQARRALDRGGTSCHPGR